MKKAILLSAATCLLVSGCLVECNSNNRATGTRIKEHTLKQFEVGSTTKEWTLAILGNPNSDETLDDGTEIWKYQYSRNVDRDTTVFLLFTGRDNRTEKQTAFFEFKDNILSRYWVEED